MTPPTAAAQRAIRNTYRLGFTLPECARIHSTSFRTVRATVLSAGIMRGKGRSGPRPHSKRRKVTVEQEAAIRASTEPVAALVARYGITKQRVGQIRKQH